MWAANAVGWYQSSSFSTSRNSDSMWISSCLDLRCVLISSVALRAEPLPLVLAPPSEPTMSISMTLRGAVTLPHCELVENGRW